MRHDTNQGARHDPGPGREDDVPELGDLDGLVRLYETAVDSIMVMNIPEAERQAMLARIEAAFERARATARVSVHVPYGPGGDELNG